MWAPAQRWPRWPLLDQYGLDVTRQVDSVGARPLVCRDDVLNRLAAALLRRNGASVALIGLPGCGRGSSIHDLAQRLVSGDVPAGLVGRQCYLLDAARLMVDTRYRGEMEGRLDKLAQEVRAGHGRLIVVLQRATLLLAGEGGSASGGAALHRLLEAGSWILPLAPDEFTSLLHAIPDGDIVFQRLALPAWNDELATKAAALNIPGLMTHHSVTFRDDAPHLAVHLARRYLPTRALPGSAVDLLDEAAAVTRASNSSVVDRACLLAAIAGRTGLPLQGLDLTAPGALAEHDRWQDIEASLTRRVVGQGPAVTAVASALRRARAGLNDPRRPLGSLLFIGPTGVGKTELARALAEFLFGDESALVRIDMSEYLERHAVARLLGAPPGYVGFELPGQLTDPVRRRPFSVVLLDEIDKAHADVLNVLLQLLEDGRLTDGHGRTVDFRSTLVIMTSNAGSVELREEGLASSEQWRRMARVLLRPELLNRLDDVIVFTPLTAEAMQDVVIAQFRRLLERFAPWQLRVELAPAARRMLAESGYEPSLGARPLRRLLEHEVLNPLATALLRGELQPGEEVVVQTITGPQRWSRRTARSQQNQQAGGVA